MLQIKNELLATTRLPIAIDFMLAELKHLGTMSSAMARLPHYFTPFQTYVISEAEAERGRFDIRVAVEILRHEAEYRSKGARRRGFSSISSNASVATVLKYDPGLGRWPRTRFSTKPGGNGSSPSGGRSASSISPT